MSNFMFVLGYILDKSGEKGENILETAFLKQHYSDFDYSYQFNERGDIVNRSPRHYTERNENESVRYKRIAFESIHDYNEKGNRNLKPNLTLSEIQQLDDICVSISSDKECEVLKNEIVKLLVSIQKRIISKL